MKFLHDLTRRRPPPFRLRRRWRQFRFDLLHKPYQLFRGGFCRKIMIFESVEPKLQALRGFQDARKPFLTGCAALLQMVIGAIPSPCPIQFSA